MKKNINYGLLILKSILAFYVVKTHCFNIKSINNKFLFYILGKNRKIHVPSFFNMSFYFNYKGLISKESNRNCKRFERLLIPYIFWPIIIYLINSVLFILTLIFLNLIFILIIIIIELFAIFLFKFKF